MRPVLTPAQCAALDRESRARGVPVDALMERAGRAVAVAAARLAGGTYGRRAVVVCGKGNNGGDGLVAARYLSRWGIRVTALLLAEPEPGRDPAHANLLRLREVAEARIGPFSEAALVRELGRSDVAVDAVFGTGFRGTPEGDPAGAIGLLRDAAVPVVAVDVPSGVDGETGAAHGPAVRADVTVTFGAEKPGILLHPGAELAGEVVVADIGFPPELVRSDLGVVEPADVAAILPRRAPEAHKRSTGVVLVLGGSREMTGAAALMARGAYRAGAGLVTVATVREAVPVVQSTIAEATFLSLPATPDGTVAWGALDRVREAAGRFDAVAVGPGLSTQDETAATIRELVRTLEVPMVIDADALNAFAGRSQDLAGRRADAVLTPHAGELARLVGIGSAEAARDRLGQARKLAAETGAVVLAKGNPTVVASPTGEARLNPTGTPALATGGSGDVLAGVLAALLSAGLGPLDAATAGAFVHGVAGRLAEEARGPGITASDVAEAIPWAVEVLLP
ncbi:MAG: NAD(P)H-hydrate dehydratase [Actinobacteria bacterium]|nr:NAD(P)H-hydrate dehydratase [Actinomycetota bacterium]